MKTRLAAFNIYFLLLLVALAPACKSPEERKKGKEASTLRLYLAESREKAGLHGVAINRQNPISFSVDSFGTGRIEDAAIQALIERHFDLPGPRVRLCRLTCSSIAGQCSVATTHSAAHRQRKGADNGNGD